MQIEIVKYPGGDRGRQAVMVDGERWAIVYTSGGVPAKYWFNQAGGRHGAIREQDGKKLRTVYVYGDNHKRRSRFSEPAEPAVAKPSLADRLLDMAKRLIADGLIVNPAVAAATIAEDRARAATATKKRNDAESNRFADRARAALDDMEQYVKMGIPPAAKEEDVAAIVELMKWAQSQ